VVTFSKVTFTIFKTVNALGQYFLPLFAKTFEKTLAKKTRNFARGFVFAIGQKSVFVPTLFVDKLCSELNVKISYGDLFQ
jgi:hypothetical protein